MKTYVLADDITIEAVQWTEEEHLKKINWTHGTPVPETRDENGVFIPSVIGSFRAMISIENRSHQVCNGDYIVKLTRPLDGCAVTFIKMMVMQQDQFEMLFERNAKIVSVKETPSAKESIGIDLIALERARQMGAEGYDSKHDDAHVNGEMAIAAACYAVVGIADTWVTREGASFSRTDAMPWGSCSDNRAKHGQNHNLRGLQIAGALIAAEIDRRLRAKGEASAGVSIILDRFDHTLKEIMRANAKLRDRMIELTDESMRIKKYLNRQPKTIREVQTVPGREWMIFPWPMDGERSSIRFTVDIQNGVLSGPELRECNQSEIEKFIEGFFRAMQLLEWLPEQKEKRS